MRMEIFRTIIASKLLHGSRCFVPNKSMMNKIKSIEHKYYKKTLSLFISTDNVKAGYYTDYHH